MTHLFRIGQAVDLMPRTARPAAPGGYEVLRLLPVESSRDIPRYRIKSIAEKHERVAAESELTATPEKSTPGVSQARQRAEVEFFKARPAKR